MGNAFGLVLGSNDRVRPAIEGAGEEKIDLPGVGLSRTGFVGSVCGSLPPGRRPLRVRGRERGRRQAMDTMEKATKAIELALMSLDYKTAPRYDKDTIEQARFETSEGLRIALTLLNERKGASK